MRFLMMMVVAGLVACDESELSEAELETAEDMGWAEKGESADVVSGDEDLECLRNVAEETWEEFCGDMGLNVCHDAPFDYCCGETTL
ncbi:MAG: hypothetical protein ACI8RZ_005770 [Myxococcota bacterium]|jgi:hypothetical protein